MRVLIILFVVLFQAFSGNAKNIFVTNKSQLLAAFQNAKSGDVILISNSSKIDLSGEKNIVVNSGITIKAQNSTGLKPLIHTELNGTKPLFKIVGSNVCFSGLRIQGPDGSVYSGEDAFKNKSKSQIEKNRNVYYKQNMYKVPVSNAFSIGSSSVIIENCELFNWPFAAIYVGNNSNNVKIINNFIHHNQRFGLGYGVQVDGGEALIEGNKFSTNGHSVACTGKVGSKYIVKNNEFRNDRNNSWSVDVHGGVDRKDNSNWAGTRFLVTNNDFYISGTTRAFAIRGEPVEYAKVENNRVFVCKNNAKSLPYYFVQWNSKRKFSTSNNKLIFSNELCN
ncbi:right-handed parallel beta-helix repeat-containing protein [Sphingobacterium cellulitidis]|uniref:right-handed parallel beta-helix repeat-containing protein n=1 Tax=Sphingobacterium cellulitidis TaxID=1768011 RepID=UPI000B94417B|nr:hypothetical protein CHT99_11725 [Sphingobacterium cellulitidis]